MATKINQTVYGTVPTTQYSVIACPKTVLDLYNDGNFDPSGNCENGFEKSISPWGIGGGMCCDWFTINAQRSADGRFARLRMDTMENYNKPVSFWNKSVGSSPYDNKGSTRCRIAGNCFKTANDNIESNGATEYGLTLVGINRVNSPYGKLEYNNACTYPLYVNVTRNENAANNKLMPLGNYTVAQLDSFGDSWFEDSFEISGFTWGFSMFNSASSVPNQFYPVSIAPVTTKAFKAGEMYKALALEDSNNLDTFYDDIIISGPNVCGAYILGSGVGYGHLCDVSNNYIKLISNKFTDTMHRNYCETGAGRLYGVGNGNKHVFDDVSYHYEIKFFFKLNGIFTEVKENELILSSQDLYILPYYKIDDTTYSSKWESLKAIIKHEIAFIGFPFVMDETQCNFIGTSNVNVPIFDAHMITTGNYVTGAAGSQLPNSQWGDIFSDTMPEYDPDYNPPAPSPSLPDEDSGYLNQRTYHGYHMQGSNKYYALNETELIQLIAEINGLYADTSSTPDPSILDTLQKQVAVNFKGSNPADYIVGIYGYPFGIPHVATSSPVMIGPVGTSISASIVESQAVGAMTFGSITVPNVGNFLDYAPYSQIQLYLPMLGTVDLDPAFYMGHEVSVEYIYDINTGSLSGVVYRDDIIDKIIDGSLCAQVPVTARNMGDYQNNLHQMKMALVNSALSGVQNSLGLFTEGAKTVQGSMNGDSPLAGMTMSSVDIFAVPFNAGQGISSAVYAIEHSMPKLATTSTASSNNAMQFDFTPVLFIKRASMLPEYDSELYGHTVGFACCINKTIGDMSGLTVATNIDTSNITTASGQALTADEINAIKQAFSNGVYV